MPRLARTRRGVLRTAASRGRRVAFAAAALATALISACGGGSRFREIPVLDPAKLRKWCALDEASVTLEQAKCIAGAAGLDTSQDVCTIDEGENLQREPVWIVRERCDAVPRCLEIWIRKSDGAIVNSRYPWVFRQPGAAHGD